MLNSYNGVFVIIDKVFVFKVMDIFTFLENGVGFIEVKPKQLIQHIMGKFIIIK